MHYLQKMKNKETLEEAANRMYEPNLNCQGEDSEYYERAAFIKGAEWQAERMYSEEDIEKAHFAGKIGRESFNIWFEQFKKK